MLTIKRHELILQMLTQFDVVTLQQFVEKTNSSESTIRRDLSLLESQGKLQRVHGGATRVVEKHQDATLAEKSEKHIKEKVEIAQRACQLIKEKDCIYLDAGTSTLAMIPLLQQKNLTVVTNGLTHVAPLLEKGYEVYAIGGFVKESTLASIGMPAVTSIRQFNFDIAFLGSNGVDLNAGFTTPDIEEATVKRAAIHQSKQHFFLVDDSKFNITTFAHVSPLELRNIITNLSNPYMKQFGKYVIAPADYHI